MAERNCADPNCTRPHHARGLCHRHYQLATRRGVLAPRRRLSVEERFWAKVEKRAGCWIWRGAVSTGTTYGSFYVDRATKVGAHRYSYTLLRGAIPEGSDLDHLCRQRLCVNPDHLEPVTRQENVQRGSWGHAMRKHCKHGHPYTPENTHFYRGARRCRECNRLWLQRKRLAK